MRASHNELLSLLKQYFEAHGLHQGIYDAASESIVWSESHGFNGLGSLQSIVQASDFVELEYCRVRDRSDMLIALDVASSAAFWGKTVVDLGVVNSLSSGYCEVRLYGGVDHNLMLKEFIAAGRKKLHVRGVWSHEGRSVVADIRPSACNVTYAEYEQSKSRNTTHAVLYFSKLELSDIDNEPLYTWSAIQSEDAYRLSLDAGVVISKRLWANLHKGASKVLVESNEQSRHGAGA